MLRRWVSRNVDLALVAERVREFFETKGYGTRKEKLVNGYGISLTPLGSEDAGGRLAVNVLGNPNDFSVEFVAADQARSSTLWGYITTLFGGGIFLRQSLKFREALDKLETEFWGCLEDAIQKLTGSANR